MLKSLLAPLALILSGLASAQDSFREQCNDVRASVAAIPNVIINLVEFVPNSTNLTFPDNVGKYYSRSGEQS